MTVYLDRSMMMVIHTRLSLYPLICITYYTKDIGLMDRYLVQTQLQTKSSGIKLLEIHGVKTNLNPNSLPEKWKHPLHL